MECPSVKSSLDSAFERVDRAGEMKRHRGRILNDALENYFSIFDSTRSLATELIRKRKNPVEVLILLCARLDAIASDAASEAASSKKAFVHFLTAYGGNKDLFECVSVGDLYYELGYHRWLLEGTIPKAGRLHRFSEINDPIIRLFEGAGLPITLKDSAILLETLMRILKDEGQVRELLDILAGSYPLTAVHRGRPRPCIPHRVLF